MKKIITSIALLGTISSAVAQVPANPGFEDWADGDPVGWWTTDQAFPPGIEGDTAVTASNDAYSGNYAAKVAVIANPEPGEDNLQGMLALGFNPGNIPLGGGIPYTGRPDSVIAYVKYHTEPGDSILVFARVIKNGAPVGGYGTSLGGDQASYTRIELPFTYVNSDTPDSLQIFFGVGMHEGHTTIGSYLIVDDVAIIESDSANGIDDITKNAINIYPNPAASHIQFSEYANVKLHNIAGQLVADKQNVNTLDISGLPAGVYILTFTDKKGDIIQRRKFTKK